MKFTIDRKHFIDGLSVGSSMAGKAKVLPVLDNVKVVIKGDSALITSNSTQCCITKKVSLVSSDEDIEFLVNPNDLLKALKSLKDNELTIDVSSTTLRIVHKRGVIEMSVIGADDFPIMDKVESANVHTIDSERLFTWLNIARDFASTDELRPAMCGMLLYAKDGRIGACATDTRVLFADSYVAETAGDIECIIPSTAFSALQSVLNGTDSVQVMFNEKNISFKTTDARLTCQLVVGRFPNFKAVIPQGYELQTGFDKTALLDSVSRVGMFSDKSHSLIVLDIQDGKCQFKGSDLMLGKSATDECECIHGGDDITIGVSSEYFIRCINHISGDDIVMEMSNPTRPILFTDKNYPSLRIVVMPMNISN